MKRTGRGSRLVEHSKERNKGIASEREAEHHNKKYRKPVCLVTINNTN